MAQGKSGAIYTGISVDPVRRVTEHNTSLRGAKWARKERPLSLLCFHPVGSRSEALKLEARIKRLRRTDKLKCVESGFSAIAKVITDDSQAINN